MPHTTPAAHRPCRTPPLPHTTPARPADSSFMLLLFMLILSMLILSMLLLSMLLLFMLVLSMLLLAMLLQVVNILIGLGVPWLLTTCAGLEVAMPDTKSTERLTTMSYVMFACAVAYVSILLPSFRTWGREGAATLGRTGGWYLFAVYALAIATFFVATGI